MQRDESTALQRLIGRLRPSRRGYAAGDPGLKAGDIAVMDNLGSHNSPTVRQMIRKAGARLPPYSQDLDPSSKSSPRSSIGYAWCRNVHRRRQRSHRPPREKRSAQRVQQPRRRRRIGFHQEIVSRSQRVGEGLYFRLDETRNSGLVARSEAPPFAP